jgi:hypothetical protein
MSISRFLFCGSLSEKVFSYPLPFTGARDGVMDSIQVDKALYWFRFRQHLDGRYVGHYCRLAIPDVSFVLAFAGADAWKPLDLYLPPPPCLEVPKNPTKLQKFGRRSVHLIGHIPYAIKAVQSIFKAASCAACLHYVWLHCIVSYRIVSV